VDVKVEKGSTEGDRDYWIIAFLPEVL